MRSFLGLWLTLVCALVSLRQSVAHASPSYTGVLKRSLDLGCEPACTLCHTDPEGGFATTNTKFGITLRQMFHAKCCDNAALESIVVQLKASQVDSDQDGVTDAEELQALTDPNTKEDVALECREPADKGCALALAAAGESARWPLLGVVVALVLLRRRSARTR